MAKYGVGIYNDGVLCLGYKSFISFFDNKVSELTGGILFNYTPQEGGIYNTATGQVYISSGNIKYNADDGSSSGGGGLMNCGIASMSGGTIYKNAAKSGGGVYLAANSTFSLGGGSIKENSALNSGGAVYVASDTSYFSLASNADIPATNSVVDSNELNTVFLNGSATLTITNALSESLGKIWIRMASYTNNREVLKLAEGTDVDLASQIDRFGIICPRDTSYSLSSEGQLTANQELLKVFHLILKSAILIAS